MREQLFCLLQLKEELHLHTMYKSPPRALCAPPLRACEELFWEVRRVERKHMLQRSLAPAVGRQGGLPRLGIPCTAGCFPMGLIGAQVVRRGARRAQQLLPDGLTRTDAL